MVCPAGFLIGNAREFAIERTLYFEVCVVPTEFRRKMLPQRHTSRVFLS